MTKSLLPKRIAGVKIPKKVRKGQFADILNSKAGQALIAEAVMAVAALAAAKKAKDSPKIRGAMADAKDKVFDTGKDANDSAATLTYALGEAVRSFSDALHRGPDGGIASEWSAETAPHARPEAKKKPGPSLSPSATAN